MERLNFEKLKEYELPKPYVRRQMNTMSPDEKDIFDSIVSSATRGMSEDEIMNVVKKALKVAFDYESPAIFRQQAKNYYNS